MCARCSRWARRAGAAPRLRGRPHSPERLCKARTDCLPSVAVLVADTGFAAIWTGTQVYLTHPDQRYTRCAGSLGWGFPASLGVKCAAPDRPVLCFTSDGFWYHLSELETARRCGIHTVTMVNNNSGLGQCLGSIEKLYAGRPGDPDEMCRFSHVNFARIAAEMGCWGVRVEKPSEIAEARRRALAADRPAIVEVITDAKCPAPEPWAP